MSVIVGSIVYVSYYTIPCMYQVIVGSFVQKTLFYVLLLIELRYSNALIMCVVVMSDVVVVAVVVTSVVHCCRLWGMRTMAEVYMCCCYE